MFKNTNTCEMRINIKYLQVAREKLAAGARKSISIFSFISCYIHRIVIIFGECVHHDWSTTFFKYHEHLSNRK